jgi:hypothetical protein
VATSVARLTSAAVTPSRRSSALSTRRTQEAQVMPPMSRVPLALAAVPVDVLVVIALSWGPGSGYG